ncbi:MAG TPA: hypothetical protein VG452_10190 [Egibacteraceae bacterium]|nr:hypothetical protein [Egibacteraceae bacterium]
MSDPAASTEPIDGAAPAPGGPGRPLRSPDRPDPAVAAGTRPEPGEPPRRDQARERHVPDPIETFKREDNWIKLLLTVAGMSAITLVLLVAVAVSVLGGGRSEPVLVDDVPCIVVPEGDSNVLYCRR